MSLFLAGSAFFVLCATALGLLRLLKGPRAVDRMMTVQLAGTAGAGVCLLLAIARDMPSLIDVALTLAVLAVLGTATISRLAAREPARGLPSPPPSTEA